MKERQKNFLEKLFLDDLFHTKDGAEAYFKILEYVELFGNSPEVGDGNGHSFVLKRVKVDKNADT